MIRCISELLYKWKAKLSSLQFDTKPESKIGIRSKLSHMYFSAIKDETSTQLPADPTRHNAVLTPSLAPLTNQHL